jgi:hypothetical protein
MPRKKRAEGDKKPKRELPTITVRFPPRVKAVIAALAEEDLRSSAAWIEKSIIDKLKELGRYPTPSDDDIGKD